MVEGVMEKTGSAQTIMRNPSAASDRISPEAFEQLFLTTYPRLVSILRRMLGDSGRAEELASEAFLKLCRTELPSSTMPNIPGWLYRTAMNLGIDDLRARAQHIRGAQEAARGTSSSGAAEDGLQQLLRSERQQRVRCVLAKLKPEWARLLLLRASGYSYKELAEYLELAPTSIGTMLIRAEAAFEKCYLELFGTKD